MIWLLVLPVCVALFLTVMNLFFWPRGHATETDNRVTVLIPARNEASNIEDVLRSVLKNKEVERVVVYDDRSTDGTGELIDAIAVEDDRVERVAGIELPDGWVGKPHACHRLGLAALDAKTLLFLDADVELTFDGVRRILDIQARYQSNAVTAVPKQVCGSFVERLIVPLLHMTYTSWLPMPLVWLSNDARFLAANGQLFLIDRATYDRVGGFEAVKDAVVDDMAMATLLKKEKAKIVFADGFRIASCRMYRDATGVWEGFSKNIFEGIGSIVGLAFVIALYFTAFVLPYILLGLGVFNFDFLPIGVVGVGANLLLRSLLTVRFSHPVEGIFLQPFAVIGLLAIAVNSARWNFSDSIVWRGRTYARRTKR